MLAHTFNGEGESVDFLDLFDETLVDESAELGNWGPFFLNGASLATLGISASAEAYKENGEPKKVGSDEIPLPPLPLPSPLPSLLSPSL